MFCPHCHAEYRQGFTRCHDCDADLVYELNAQDLNARADESAPADTLHGLRVLWRDTSQEACVTLCYKLRDQGIPYKVKETAGSVGIDMRAVRRYELAVSSDHYHRAKTVLQVNDDLPETISEDEWKKLERHEAPDVPDEENESILPGEDGVEADRAGNPAPLISHVSSNSDAKLIFAPGIPKMPLRRSGRRWATWIFQARSRWH